MSSEKLKNILTANHIRTPRDYSQRAGTDKPKLSELARNFGFDYWDGDRKTGYGGYKNDGRWLPLAQKFIELYSLTNQSSLLDVGCGKGYLLGEVKKLLPQIKIAGVDISEYALQQANQEIAKHLSLASAENINFAANSFDLVVSINTLHNLKLPQLYTALQKIQTVQKNNSYICVESYRNESEKWNLMRWQLTCECFFTPEEWVWIFNQAGYKGDYEFIFFE